MMIFLFYDVNCYCAITAPPSKVLARIIYTMN